MDKAELYYIYVVLLMIALAILRVRTISLTAQMFTSLKYTYRAYKILQNKAIREIFLIS